MTPPEFCFRCLIAKTRGRRVRIALAHEGAFALSWEFFHEPWHWNPHFIEGGILMTVVWIVTVVLLHEEVV